MKWRSITVDLFVIYTEDEAGVDNMHKRKAHLVDQLYGKKIKHKKCPWYSSSMSKFRVLNKNELEEQMPVRLFFCVLGNFSFSGILGMDTLADI